MLNKFVMVIVSCGLVSCGDSDKDCVQSSEINCLVNRENFGKIHLGMAIDSVNLLLGLANIYKPELGDIPPANVGHYSWNRNVGMAVAKFHKIDPSIYVETEKGNVISAKFVDGTLEIQK